MEGRGLFCAVVLTSVWCQAVQADFPDFAICTDGADQRNQDISGGFVVWEDWRSGDGDIYGYDLSYYDPNTGLAQPNGVFPICWNGAGQFYPSVNGDTVVWTDNRSGTWDVYGKTLPDGAEFPVCTSPVAGETAPDIDGDLVVYEYVYGGWDIYLKNLTTGGNVPICTASGDQWDTSISGDWVVWNDDRNGNWDVYGYNLVSGQEFEICTDGADQRFPAIDGNRVVWFDERNGGWDIYGRELPLEDAEFRITGDEAHPTPYSGGPGISGDWLAWTDTRNGNDDIYGYDLSAGGEDFPICRDSADQWGPIINGNMVVWTDLRSGNQDIYGAIIPEPGTLSVLLIGGLVLLRRHSR